MKGYLALVMASNGHSTNGTNGHGTKKVRTPKNAFAPERKPVPPPTATQQRARRDYVREAGVTVTPEEVEKISSQWSR